MESRTEFDQRADPTLNQDPAARRCGNTRDQLENGALAGTVWPDNAERLPPVHTEGRVAQGPKVTVARGRFDGHSAPSPGKHSFQSVAQRAVVPHITLGDLL